jgi:sulfatase modifying factor 1
MCLNKICLFFIAVLFAGCTDSKPENTPEGMVFIPSGNFIMGGKLDDASRDEYPNIEVKVSAFYMDATEVTNLQFSEFVKSTGYITVAEQALDWAELSKGLPAEAVKPPDSVLMPGSLVFKKTNGPVDMRAYDLWWQWKVGASWSHPYGPESSIDGRDNEPVVHIALADAKAYTKWAGKRLPTEAEWEWAAMGGLDNVVYPWGNELASKSAEMANFWQGFFPYENTLLDGYEGLAPVKTYLPNGYGLYDMAGNVWEWCQDKYDSNSYQEALKADDIINPTGSEKYFDPNDPFSQKHVIRGGSYLCNDSYCSGYRVSRRMSTTADSGLSHLGFRCVKDIE